MLAPELAQLAIAVDAPEAWLGKLVPAARGRVHPRTPRELRRSLRPFLGDGERGQGWICTRVFDGQAHPPLRPLDPLALGEWIVEFSFARRSWITALFGLGGRRDRSWRGLESRARAFLEADLREVEQWSVDGFPELCVTLGRVGPLALAQHKAREPIVVDPAP